MIKDKGAEKMHTFEKIGDYKKAMKAFIKGAVKSKLYQTEQGDLIVTLAKSSVKKLKDGVPTYAVSLKVVSPCGCVTSEFKADVVTRAYNKITPALFDPIGEQLEKSKSFVGALKLRVESLDAQAQDPDAE